MQFSFKKMDLDPLNELCVGFCHTLGDHLEHVTKQDHDEHFLCLASILTMSNVCPIKGRNY